VIVELMGIVYFYVRENRKICMLPLPDCVLDYILYFVSWLIDKTQYNIFKYLPFVNALHYYIYRTADETISYKNIHPDTKKSNIMHPALCTLAIDLMTFSRYT